MPRKPSPLPCGRPVVYKIRCSKCGKKPSDPEHPEKEFWKNKVKANGFTSACIACIRSQEKEPVASKTCPKCETFYEKATDGFTVNRGHRDGLASNCRTCANDIVRPKNRLKFQDPAFREKQRAYSESRKDRDRELHTLRRRFRKANKWARYLTESCIRNAGRMGRPCELDEQFLLDLFDQQGGCCYWYGVPMVPSDKKKDPQNPSVDRLDTSRGYERNNVVLCTQSANYGRNSYSAEEFGDFVRLIKK